MFNLIRVQKVLWRKNKKTNDLLLLTTQSFLGKWYVRMGHFWSVLFLILINQDQKQGWTQYLIHSNKKRKVPEKSLKKKTPSQNYFQQIKGAKFETWDNSEKWLNEPTCTNIIYIGQFNHYSPQSLPECVVRRDEVCRLT